MGLRQYHDADAQVVDWPGGAYAPMPGVPPCVEVPAMRAALGNETGTQWSEEIFELREDLTTEERAFVIEQLITLGIIDV